MTDVEATPLRRTSIAEIRAIDSVTSRSGHELIAPEEDRERNLQNAFVEVLATAGVPFDTAYQIADVAWDVHKTQLDRRSSPDEQLIQRELSAEEKEVKERWEQMSQDEREDYSREVWDRQQARPGAKSSMRRGIRDTEAGRYYFTREIDEVRERIPTLKVVKKSEARKRNEQ